MMDQTIWDFVENRLDANSKNAVVNQILSGEIDLNEVIEIKGHLTLIKKFGNTVPDKDFAEETLHLCITKGKLQTVNNLEKPNMITIYSIFAILAVLFGSLLVRYYFLHRIKTVTIININSVVFSKNLPLLFIFIFSIFLMLMLDTFLSQKKYKA